MVNENKHPRTFRDPPEARILSIHVDMKPENYVKDGPMHKVILDEAIHQTMIETGYKDTTDVLSSQLSPDDHKYEATIMANGSEIFFHALGSACMQKLSQVGVTVPNQLNIGWRINPPQSMRPPVVPE